MRKAHTETLDFQKINKKIADIWDMNVNGRIEDIISKADQSYISAIKPWVIRKIQDYSENTSNILDIGCGFGYLTDCIFQSNRKQIIGIDISKKSVENAIKMYPHIQFMNEDIYNFVSQTQYDLCTAIMLLNNLPNIDMFFEKLRELLKKTEKLLF